MMVDTILVILLISILNESFMYLKVKAMTTHTNLSEPKLRWLLLFVWQKPIKDINQFIHIWTLKRDPFLFNF